MSIVEGLFVISLSYCTSHKCTPCHGMVSTFHCSPYLWPWSSTFSVSNHNFNSKFDILKSPKHLPSTFTESTATKCPTTGVSHSGEEEERRHAGKLQEKHTVHGVQRSEKWVGTINRQKNQIKHSKEESRWSNAGQSFYIGRKKTKVRVNSHCCK